jgi:thiosulfate dehydrogenase
MKRTLTLSVTVIALCAFSLQAAEIPPAPKAYPEGEVGRMVKLGEAIMNQTDTHPLTKDLVGDKLQCKS